VITFFNFFPNNLVAMKTCGWVIFVLQMLA